MIRDVCRILAEYLLNEGTERLKISEYANMLAMSEPDRVLKIAANLNSKDQSPLISLESLVGDYLKRKIKEENLHPIKTEDEIMQFIVASYHGIQIGYILSECYPLPRVTHRYQPEVMFSCLAESVIHMMKGRE